MLRRRLLSIIPFAVLLAALPISASASSDLPPGFFVREIDHGFEAGWLGEVYAKMPRRPRAEIEAWATNSWRIQMMVAEGIFEHDAAAIVAKGDPSGFAFGDVLILFASPRPNLEFWKLSVGNGPIRERIFWKMRGSDGAYSQEIDMAYLAELRSSATIDR
jgi:hypothetical protein